MKKNDKTEWLTGDRAVVKVENMSRKCSTVGAEIASARAKMSAMELKAFYQISTLVKMDDDNLFNYEINIFDFADAMGIRRSVEVVDRFIDTLIEQCFKIRRENGSWKKIAVFSFFEYDTETKQMRVAFNDQMRPYLLELKAFTKIDDIRILKRFSSKYAIRFYVLFKDRLFLGSVEFNIDDIATMFELPKSYRNYGLVSQKVIAPALKEINAISDIWVREPEIVSKERHNKVARIRFEFGEKERRKSKRCRACGVVSKK